MFDDIPQAMPGAELCQPFRLECRSSPYLYIIINRSMCGAGNCTSTQLLYTNPVMDGIFVARGNNPVIDEQPTTTTPDEVAL